MLFIGVLCGYDIVADKLFINVLCGYDVVADKLFIGVLCGYDVVAAHILDLKRAQLRHCNKWVTFVYIKLVLKKLYFWY